MRIKWIELHNYAGIYNGMGLNQIKIDFTKCKTNKIIIRGANGSGKSTLINSIHINPDTNENFIPECEARKNICIIDFDTEYYIRYIHPVNTNGNRGSTKGYISKLINGQMVELNTNGNISSCKDILYDIFNLDSNFIALSQLSSEDRGLVEKKPAERKRFVNSIINILDTYNNIYKTLNKKSSIFKSTINMLTYKIDDIGNETVLQMNLKNIDKVISDLEIKKNDYISNIAMSKLKLSEIDKILKENKYDDIVNEINELDYNIKTLDKYINNMLVVLKIDNIDKLSELHDFVNKQMSDLSASIDLKRQNIPIILAEREAEFIKLQDKTERLNALQSDYNYLDIKNATIEARNKIVEYDSIFTSMGLLNINIITKEEFDAAMESLHYLRDIANNMTSLYDYDSLLLAYNDRINIKNDMINLPNERKINESLKNELSNLEIKINTFEAKREMASELSNRPKDCNIDSCPYIKSAIEANNQFPELEYNNLIVNSNNIKVSIEESNNKISKTEALSQIIIQMESIERELRSKMKFINKLPVDKDFVNTFIVRMINGDRFNDIEKLYPYVDCGNMIEEYKLAKDNLHNYEVEYKIYESKNEIIESVIKDIEELTNKTSELANSIDKENDVIFSMQNKLEDLKTINSKLENLVFKIDKEYNPYVNRREELNKIKYSLDSNITLMNDLNNNLNVLNMNMANNENEISNHTKERDKLKHSYALLQEYKEELAIYNNKYTKIEKIKYYSSPSTGIQTLFMELYMNKIITIANNLLSLLFNGEFTIQPFIINENEFRIPCAGNGLMHDDISSMSTAQKCMISMILSFSLLHQSSTKYNIIKLDEIDGGLDTRNRGYFITLLDQLMSMLDCEQCFIVSHNNELDTSMSDIIVLKNESSEQYSGNIIWQY